VTLALFALTVKTMTTSLRTALVLLTVSVPLLLAGSAQATSDDPVSCMALGCPGQPSAVVEVARDELAKNVSERNGNNVPRYNEGRGAITPYAIKDFAAPWDMTFASWVLQKAGYNGHLRDAASLKIHGGGRAVAYTGAMTKAARKAGKLRKAPRPGYLAMYGDRHVEIVTRVVSGRQLVTIGGNTRDGVSRVVNPKGITHYIAPW
jgi:hypothetical protein